MGLCVPKECDASSLQVLNQFYKHFIKLSGRIDNPMDPEYTFPQQLNMEIEGSVQNPTFIVMVILIALAVIISIVGYFIETKPIGDKRKHRTSMVEIYDEDEPERISVLSKKKKWALVLYAFSLSKNFSEIFFVPYRSIRDKKFEVFNGLKFQMMIWIILGHCYLMSIKYGNSTANMTQRALNIFPAQIIISADFPISFFYCMSSFIGMLSLIKKYQTK